MKIKLPAKPSLRQMAPVLVCLALIALLLVLVPMAMKYLSRSPVDTVSVSPTLTYLPSLFSRYQKSPVFS